MLIYNMNMIEQKIEDIVIELIDKRKEINESIELGSLNLSSFEFIQMIVAIEEKFDIEFEMEDLVEDRFKTVGDLKNRVYQLIENRSNSME